MADYTDTILSTIEAFLETAPELEEDDVQKIEFSPRHTDEFETHLTVTIDGEAYAVKVCKL